MRQMMSSAPVQHCYPAPKAQPTRTLIRIAALAYLVFVVYGSLVPLDFRAIELTEAIERFQRIPFLDLGIDSRADWVANLLLFIPLSYLFAASVSPVGRRALILTLVVIAIGCAALSVAIEFTQIFFPPRTVSQNDIMAEALGGVLGLAAWWVWGERSVEWLASWQDARGAANIAEKLLWLYLLVLFGYNLLPLDLTISLVEIYHKWNEGRLNLIPFAATPIDPVHLLYEVVIDAVLWIPISLLLVISGRVSARGAVLLTLAVAALLEVLQLLVYSRYSDVTDLITALPGAFAGVWMAARVRTQATPLGSAAAERGVRVWLIVVAIAGWCLLLAAVFWYPFNISRDADLLQRGVDAFFQVPFVAYYFGSELRAITEVFHKVGFFMPLGALLAWLRWALGHRGSLSMLDVMLLLALIGPPLVIELGQVALVDKHPGSTDLVLEWLGAVVGYVSLIMLARRWREDTGHEVTAANLPSAPPLSPSPVAMGASESLHQKSPSVCNIAATPVSYALHQPVRANLPPYAMTAMAWTVCVATATFSPSKSFPVLPLTMMDATLGDPLPIVWAIVVTMLLFFASNFNLVPQWRVSLIQQPRTVVIAACAVVAMVAMLPLRPDSLVPEAFSHGYGRPDERLYLLLKGIILWVPLGVIGSIAGVGRSLCRWGIAGAVSFFVITLPLMAEMLVKDLYEVLAAPLGIGLGTWLGGRVLPHAEHPLSQAQPIPTAGPARSMSRKRVLQHIQPEEVKYMTAYDSASPVPSIGVEGVPKPTHVQMAKDRGFMTVSRTVSLILLLPTLIWAWLFPVFGPALASALAVFFTIAARWPAAVLIAVPWALPALDLAPWTGRVFLDEFDLLLLTSLAVAVWHSPVQHARVFIPRGLRVAVYLFGLSCLGGMVVGLLPLQELDGNAFSSYRSHFNALRVGKGFAWAAILVWLLAYLPWRRDWQQHVLNGTALGLISVGLVAVWERWLFASVWDFSIDYRVMATFSSMHVGGAHIEAYVVLALPMAAHFLRVANRPWQFVLAATALLLGSFLLVSTVARGALLGLVASVLVYGLGLLVQRSRGRSRSSLRTGATASVSLAVGSILAIGIGGAFFQERLARSSEDLQTRLAHWVEAVQIMNDGPGTMLIGMGLGQFPETYLLRATPSRLPGTYRFETVNGNTHLALGAGETLYFTQRIELKPDTRYRLTLRTRSDGGDAVLNTTLCERHLSHSRRCVWPAVTMPGDGQWHAKTLEIQSADVGRGSFLTRAPVDFALYNPTESAVVLVDDLQLTGPNGSKLLRNGGFSAGGDYWFIKTHEHLSWHVKNLWVAIYFEQGLLGVVLFTLLTLLVAARLVRGVRAGSRFALAVLASMVGFLAIGTVGSLFDAPRLTLLYFGVAALGIRHLAGGTSRA